MPATGHTIEGGAPPPGWAVIMRHHLGPRPGYSSSTITKTTGAVNLPAVESTKADGVGGVIPSLKLTSATIWG